MIAKVFDDRACLLGEGPLWHPIRKQLFWFDIMGKRLLMREAEGRRDWSFDRHVSAAGWVSRDELMLATERDLILFDIPSGRTEHIVSLEADDPVTRSNDGRADPNGGFWIGTMGKRADPKVGALYRYYKGELRKLRDQVTISNAICFSPDGAWAYFADTAERQVWRIQLDDQGWPKGEWRVFLDQREAELNPDGAVIDSQGRFWCAEWGASRVACYDAEGQLVDQARVPVPQPSCPAFGGPEGRTLFITTARQGLTPVALEAAPLSGQTFAIEVAATGQIEHQVLL